MKAEIGPMPYDIPLFARYNALGRRLTCQLDGCNAFIVHKEGAGAPRRFCCRKHQQRHWDLENRPPLLEGRGPVRNR